MPASSEHARRVREGLEFLSDPHAEKYYNDRVIEYFYVALHMFEAALYDFGQKPAKHLYKHGDRTQFLSRVRFDPKHPFFEMVADYEALRSLSEQARYLSPAGAETYEPLRVPRDIEQAKMYFQKIRSVIEALYTSNSKPIPWA